VRIVSYFVTGQGARQKSLFAASALIALAPLWIMPTDFWDGEIIDFAFRRDDFEGLRAWFFESRWNLQYYLYEFIRAISKITGIGHRVLIPAITCLAVVGVAVEVERLAKSMLRLEGRAPFLAAIFALLFPAWHVLTSSVLLMHILCVWWVLLGYRLSKSRAAVVGLLLAAASLQLNSNFMFLGGLAFADYLSGRFLQRHDGPTIQRCVVWAVSLVGALLILKLGFPAYGQYAAYNIPRLSFALVVDFGRYLGACLPLLVILFALFSAAHRFQPAEKRDLVWRIGILLGLFSAAVIPYVVAGKPAHPEHFNEWTHRNAFLLVVFGSLTFATLAHVFEQRFLGSIARSRLFGTILTLCAISSAALLYLGYDFKVAQAGYMDSLGVALKKMGEPPSGGVSLVRDASSPIPARSYELNFLLEKAFGRAAWLNIILVPDLLQSLKEYSQLPRKYRTMWIFPDMTPDCVSVIRIRTHSTPWWQAKSWLWLLGLSEPPVTMTTKLTDIRCG
jgi:hypothetical protein